MLSFKTLAIAFTLAASTFSWAAPLNVDITSTPNVKSIDVTARTTEISLTQILTTVNSKIVPLAAKITALNVDEITVEVVTPLIIEVQSTLQVALNQVNALVSSPVPTVTALVSGVLSITGLANLIATLLCTVFTLLRFLLNVVQIAKLDVITPLIQSVAKLVADLVVAVLGVPVLYSILAPVLAIVVPLLADVIGVIQTLGLTDLLSVLGL
ncbi:hypothetical protein C8J56DRAFT_1030606 [Mycena floridula]|nr:hypothetical protein C8J56DRAFT_1030606 [Mycena floridula]